MRLSEVYRYELGYRLRSASTWIYAGFLFGLAFLSIHVLVDGTGAVNANAPDNIARVSIIVGMVGILVSAALFGETTIRDAETGMDALLYTAPISRMDYLGGRFLAALTVNALILLALPLGNWLATVMPYQSPDAFGPFRFATYAQAYLLFILPNLFITGSILFTIAALVRQPVPVYLGGLAIFVGYIIAMNLLMTVDNKVLAALGDTIGAATLNRLSEYRPPAERNALLVGLPIELAVNRAAWMAIATGILLALHRRFRFAIDEGKSGRSIQWPRGKDAPAVGEEPAAPIAIPAVHVARATEALARIRARQTLDVARLSLAEVAANRWFALLLVGLTGFTTLFGWETTASIFDTSTWPVTMYMLERLLDTPLFPLTFLLIAIFAGEIVWKNRDVGADEIVDATPVPEGVALAGRFTALAVVIAILQLTILAGGMIAQAAQGYYRFEIGLYIKLLFGMRLPGLLILAVMAMAIHVIVNHKYVGHLVVLVASIGPVILREAGLVNHRLLLYGGNPGFTYSDMNGFGAFVAPFAWFTLYWSAVALLLGVVTTMFWIRGREQGVRARLGEARARWRGSLTRVAAVAVALIAFTGGFVFYNTNVLNAYRGPDSAGEERAEYEKRYARFEASPQPTITGATLHLEIHPDQPAVEMRGTYRLVNKTGVAIDSIHVYLDPDIEIAALSLDAAKPVLEDAQIGYRIYELDRALAPGDSTHLAFDVAFRPRGFTNEPVQTAVVGNGAYFHRLWMPFIGYQPVFELSGTETRSRFGLPPQPPIPAPGDSTVRHRWAIRDADLVHVDATIGTAVGQTAITPGILQRSWEENGRSYFHYVTDAPISFGGTVFSGIYATAADRWNDIELAVFHHPGHEYNVPRMLRGMKASLDYLSREFGPYPYSQLRVVEMPRYGSFGTAHPQTIAFAEDAFLSRVKEGEIDTPFYGTAHEVAHTWWGGMVRGAVVRGHGLLTESLANYSAMMVTEKTFGPETAHRVYQFQKARYLTGRSAQSHEVPLLEVSGQPYLEYRKGAIALYRLRHEIGEAAVNSALRRYFEKFSGGVAPWPTSLDLYAELRAVTPDPVKPLLSDLFERITLWDVRTDSAAFRRLADGRYEVTLDVSAKKVHADSLGKETEVPMNELVEIGAFASADPDSLGGPLYLQRHRITSGRQTIRFTVLGEPQIAGIDPRRMLIDRNTSDNIKEREK